MMIYPHLAGIVGVHRPGAPFRLYNLTDGTPVHGEAPPLTAEDLEAVRAEVAGGLAREGCERWWMGPVAGPETEFQAHMTELRRLQKAIDDAFENHDADPMAWVASHGALIRHLAKDLPASHKLRVAREAAR